MASTSFSPSGRAILDSAFAEAKRRGHALVGTEHVLWAMFHVHPVPTAAPWLGKWMTTKDVDAALDSVSTFAALPRPSQHVATTPRLDAVIEAGKAIARAVTAGQFTSDSFLVGMLIDGRNLAASIIEILSGGQASKFAVLKALHVPAEDYIAKHERLRDGSEPWTLYRITAAGGVRAEESKSDSGAAAAAGAGAGAGGAGAGTGGAADSGTPVEINPPPLDGSVDIDTVMQGPTEATNWLVPGAVLMGRLPYYEDEVAGILNAGVTTIVPLVEEISMKHDYPAHIKALLQAQALSVATTSVDVLHFPIDDFDVREEPKHLVLLVEELVRRIRGGEVVYIHCLGGHGRTGTVVISLLAALTGWSASEAQKHVVVYHRARLTCKRRGCRTMLPEVRSQEKQVKEINPNMVRHKAKSQLAGSKK